MTKSSVRSKIVLIAVSFSLPLGVLLYLTVANINSRISFATKELAGTAYLRPLADVLEAVQEHELAVMTGSDCGAITNRVNAGLHALKVQNAKYGSLLEFTAEGLAKRDRAHLTIPLLEAQWDGIGAGKCAAEPDKYAKLNGDLRAMIVHAGDTSNLILDPDLDSYYLMDAVVVALPQTQSRHWKVLRESRHGIDGWRKRAGIDAALLKESDLDRVDVGVITAIKEDAGFYGTSPSLQPVLTPALAAYKASAESFIAMTEKASEGEAGAQFQAAGVSAMRASFAVWRSAVAELDVLLRARVEYDTSYRFWALALAGLALSAACGLSWYFMLSIVVPLDGLMRSLGPGATLLSECVGRIAESNKRQASGDVEAEIICEELNAHADDMRKAVYQLALHVNGAEAEVEAIGSAAEIHHA